MPRVDRLRCRDAGQCRSLGSTGPDVSERDFLAHLPRRAAGVAAPNPTLSPALHRLPPWPGSRHRPGSSASRFQRAPAV